MSATPRRAEQLHRRPSGARVVGGLFVLAGLLLNWWSIGGLVAADGWIENTTVRAVILAGQVLCVLFGLWLAVRDPLRHSPRRMRVAITAAAVAATAVGSYGGALRALATAEHRGWIQPRILSLTELCDWLPNSDHPQIGLQYLDLSSRQLAKAEARNDNVPEVLRLRQKLAHVLLQHGRGAEALALLESARELAESTGQPATTARDIRLRLGITHLRGGEVEHCIAHHNPERCLFPIRGKGVWPDPAHALSAIGHFEAYLSTEPSDHGVAWLLNLAHMAAGSYPEGIATEHLIPPSRIDSPVSVGRFRDIAGELGLDTFNTLGGAIADDFDNDGWLDIVTSSYSPCEPLHYFHNNGDGTFADWSTQAKLTEQLGGFNLVQTDYDNDGRLDILVLRGAWMGRKFGRQRNSLLRQNPDGTFSDVTEQAGLGRSAYPCQAAAWADYDNDGDLDLYIGNEYFPCELFRNNGNGTFTDVAKEAGVDGGGYAKGVSWGDYDNDGDQDLYVSNLGESNHLYRNNGDGTLTDVAVELGVQGVVEPDHKRYTFTSWFFDFDNDGWLDLYVGGYVAALKDVAADYLGLPAEGCRLEMYRNDGKGGFTNVTREMGVYDVRLPMGANYGDVNNDGFPDFYLGTGSPQFEYLVPNRLYLNVAGEQFVDATTAAAVGHLQKGHAIAFADLDNDGDQDIFAQMGGFYPADAFHNAVFENPGHGNRWLTIRLIGVHANRAAIGARLTVVVAESGAKRTIRAIVGSGGSFGANSLQAEVGLAGAEHIQSLEVQWPGSGARQRFEHLDLDQCVEITEGEDSIRVLEQPSVRLGRKND